MLAGYGVYRPQHDTHLLRAALAEAGVPRGARVLDFGTGSGALAIAAAALGAESVLALDISRAAVLTARVNVALARAAVRVVHGSWGVAQRHGPFDVVVSNPPYVPCPAEETELRSRSWDAGVDGRAVIEPMCAGIADLLAPGGFLLLVQSEYSDEGKTVHRLQDSGLDAAVVARAHVPFGPVMRRRASYLGALTDREELVVIRADKPRNVRVA